jgi:hypothetical protein
MNSYNYNFIPKMNLFILVVIFIIKANIKLDEFDAMINWVLFFESIFFVLLYYVLKAIIPWEISTFTLYQVMNSLNITVIILELIFYYLFHGSQTSIMN